MVFHAESRMGERRNEHENHAEHERRRRRPQRATAKNPAEPPFDNQRAHPQHQQRNIDHADEHDRRPDVRQQLAGLGRIGRKQVREHIHRDDRPAEQIQQYDLERAEDHQRQRAQHHAGRGSDTDTNK